MPRTDVDAPAASLYECMDCGYRTDDVSDGRLCSCGGYLKNLSVTRME